MLKKVIALTTLLCTASFCLHAEDQNTAQGSQSRKIIQYGWGMPTPGFIRNHIRTMETRPFDGVIFKLDAGREILSPERIEEEKFRKDLENCRAIKWNKFTDNFVIMLSASKQDWFDDTHWENIEHNVKMFARCAKAARCAGICFDAEPYGENPWEYSTSAYKNTKSFTQYNRMVRKRGAQFMQALESEFPGARVLTFFQLSYFESQMKMRDKKKRYASLASHKYAFVPAFLDGMLDVATENVRIVDGNEKSYYYSNSDQYYHSRKIMKKEGQKLIDRRNHHRYQNNVQAGQALYMDYIFALRNRKDPAKFLSRPEQAKWFEHNVYWALRTSDEYVWCYSEHMNWFLNKNIPEGAIEAIVSAKNKIAQRQPLSLDIKPVIEKAQALLDRDLHSNLEKREVSLSILPTGSAIPVIDGRLDDKIWDRAVELQPFVPLAAHTGKLSARTIVKVLFNNDAIYLAFACEHDSADRIPVAGDKHDSDIWRGEDVEILFSFTDRPDDFFHFMLNPANVAWDASTVSGKADLSYSPKWTHATGKSKNGWLAEIAIPWKAFGPPAPFPQSAMRVNICRQYKQKGKNSELSTWSPSYSGFRETEFFGIWKFE